MTATPNLEIPAPPDPQEGPWHCARLILGDQLNRQHSWFSQRESGILYILMEVRCESEYVTHHIQKTVGIFAAMRAFAAQLDSEGFAVHYSRIVDPDNAHAFEPNLKRILERYGIQRLQYQEPDEYRLDQVLASFAKTASFEVQRVDSEHFLTRRSEVGEFFAERKSWLMESFYRDMRKRHQILMQPDGKPMGGQWNFDHDNRKKLPRGHKVPAPKVFRNDVREVLQDLQSAKLKTLGSIRAEAFVWPITRDQALELLHDFLHRMLHSFGRYQDALSDTDWSLYHSRVAQAMNLKLIAPREVIDLAIQAWQEGPAKHNEELFAATPPPEPADYAQIEGFVRQILGWREYVRGVYWHHMPQYAEQNQLEHTRPLPSFFWDAKTKMRCVQRAIHQSLEHGYAHHIQRLMITGNFCALAGIEPSQVDAWYLGIYVDAFDWVELPNTRGMSQYADGGLLASKPYVSSANYISKMGDHCRQCHYNPKKRVEEDACPFNSLYWRYVKVHEARFRGHPRMTMMYRQLDRLADLDETLARAEYCLDNIESL